MSQIWLQIRSGSVCTVQIPCPTKNAPFRVLLWWAFGDLNPGPTGYEPGALTAELKAPKYMAGVAGLEPTTFGFGDRRSTN